VDRKTFLKTVCGAGVCGCIAHMVVGKASAEAAPAAVSSTSAPADPPDQRLALVRHQVAKLATAMSAAPASAGCAGMLMETGRECARLSGVLTQFKGNPEAYFAEAKKAWGTEFEWDKQKGVITVTGNESPCGCPLVDVKKTPAFFCNCSLGYQHAVFEAILGKPVRATLMSSKLAGAKRCVTEIHVTPEP
jgi:hypothetical protein